MIPRPQSFEPTGNTFSFTGRLKLVLEPGLPDAVHTTARIFAEELTLLGFSPEVVDWRPGMPVGITSG